jgi:hypothetical protein
LLGHSVDGHSVDRHSVDDQTHTRPHDIDADLDDPIPAFARRLDDVRLRKCPLGHGHRRSAYRLSSVRTGMG